MDSPDKPMDDDRLCRAVQLLVNDAEDYRDERGADRIRSNEYFDGIMKDTPADDNRSAVVSRDVRAAVRKVLPSVVRTILGGDEIVEYEPVGPGDEEGAEQAGDYINYVALPECRGDLAIEDAINDALRNRNGILKWYQETKIDVKVSTHTGLDENAFAMLVSDDDVEVLQHSETRKAVPTPDGQQAEEVFHDVKIRRRVTTSKTKLRAVAPENWLIYSEAICLEDSPILGENYPIRRSDLVAMGYDKDQVWSLPASTTKTGDQENEEDSRRRDPIDRSDAMPRELDEIDYYDLLVRIDYDGDGIAELRRLVFAGGLKAENLLENTEWDEINYGDIVSERRPHQWEGNSIPDESMEIQRVKSVLLRATLDNLYWQNNLQPIVQEGSVTNPESVLNPKFGQPILVSQGTPQNEAVGYSQVPFVASASFEMLGYMDGELADRTGVSDASGGLPPDALQNMTATATAMIEQAGISQIWLMTQCIARCLGPVFEGLLKLVIQHQDKPRTVRLRGKWVEFDPRSWNADMDASVNVGLGAGTRERDMLAMQQVIGMQEKIVAALGPDNPYVKPDNVYNAISDFTRSAGVKTVDRYFSRPDPAELEQMKQQQANKPTPEQEKAQAAMQIEQVRNQGKVEVEQVRSQTRMQETQAKMAADASKEREQRDADLAVQAVQIEATDRYDTEDNAIKRERIAADLLMHEQDLEARQREAAIRARSEEQRSQAERFTAWQNAQRETIN